ncbi:MAG: hypothetical protein LBG95_01205 [Treponema sp.]|nr:hypothetical protein [Treponema sp.]
MPDKKNRKPNGFVKFLITLLCVILALAAAWAAFSLFGRISAGAVIPETAALRLNVHHPAHLLEKILAHESLPEIAGMPALASAISVLKTAGESPLYKNALFRLAVGGNLEFALLPASAPSSGPFLAAWDMKAFSPLLRILPLLSGFARIPGLYYVQAGKISRFEYRMGEVTLFIGPFRNLLIVSDSSSVFESTVTGGPGEGKAYQSLKPASYDAALLVDPALLSGLLSELSSSLAGILRNVQNDSPVEAGLLVSPKKLELRLNAGLSSGQTAINQLLGQRSRAPGIAERLPSSAQYATILSAGTLDELYRAALVFSAELEETIKKADSSSRLFLGMNLDDLLFSWTGREYAVFGMEGRPHPVYAIQVANEKKRQEVFEKAFKTIVLNEDDRLNIDGMRMPRIEIPAYLQNLFRYWDIFLPSPYYTVYNGYLLASESAQTLLAALRVMQKNDVLPKTALWRNIAGGKAASSAFSLFYSLDRSVPFFLRGNTALSAFLSMYRQGLARIGFDQGQIDISLVLIPGSGGGLSLVNGYPVEIGGRPSNRVYGAGKGAESRIFMSRGNTAISINLSDNGICELSGQDPVWVIPAEGVSAKNAAYAWVVSAQGRVTLVNGGMEPAQGFPVLTGLRLSSPPTANEGRLYLCDEDGKVHALDSKGLQNTWESAFPAALRSPPSFLSVTSGRNANKYAAVYPKSFFGELWLLDSNGKVMPGWPVPVSGDGEFGSGLGFGSPLLFAHNNRAYAAFVTQAGGLFIFDEKAAPLSPFPLILEGVFYQQPVFDGDCLWLASADGTLFQVSLSGEVLQQRIPGFSVMEEGCITVFDCDGDKIPEIFISGEGNALHAYSRNFRSLEGFPLPIWGKPLLADLQGNGKPECIGLGMDRKLYRWQFR